MRTEILKGDDVADFVRHYEKPKPRKEISYDSW